MRGRARADRGPLLLTALVVFLAVLITAGVPPLLRTRGDRAVAEVVQGAGGDADLTASVTFDPESPAYPRARIDSSAEIVDGYYENALRYLDPSLEKVFGSPVASVGSGDLQVTSGTTPGLNMRLVYADSPRDEDHGPAVTWVAGEAPGAGQGSARTSDAPWPVQVGLSEATAKLLGAGPGDTISAQDYDKAPIEVHVSGVYRARRGTDDVWRTEPELLAPRTVTDTRGLTTSYFSVLMTGESLPDGRLATDPYSGLFVNLEFLPDPALVTRDSAPALIDALVQLEAGTKAYQIDGPPVIFGTGLDTLLQRLLNQIAVATALAAVLLSALLVAVALALLLTADLLARRRAGVLTGLRRRGASLPGLGAELAVESLAVAGIAGGAGLAVAWWLTGSLSLSWVWPVLLVAVLGAPVAAVSEAARATPRKAAPANRSARRTLAVTRQLRRITIEVAIVLAAAAAGTALAQRGVTANDVLPAVAPSLVAVTGGVLVLRLLPVLLRLFLRLGNRFRGALPLLAAGRAAATVSRPLPMVLIVTSVSLGVFALAVRATASGPGRPADDAHPLPPALADGLRDLALTCGLLLFLLAGLAVALGTFAGAGDRAETFARLRTLGMTPAATRRIALGELLPVAVIGGVVGWALGRVLASEAIGLLSLKMLNDLPADPALVVPAVTYLPIMLLPAAVVVLVLAESSVRRRERLGQVLRA
ncbi:ABC transporter permease [Kineosporia sp. J2-2]|uniref:ABC transporter permease n=1 Tax=Kineosporia corallincola TaxID=2835133 RepID=A0ABS5TES8_9ACTN|nr:ABC transporter permease [Kineosporia corallincola]MBT0769587.1 ABC transporter permease [Kineosporia corallincola]